MIVLLSPGHGGIGPFETYLTRGKRSPHVPPGVYEGGFNENMTGVIRAGLVNELGYNHVVNLRPGPVNTPLKSRIKYVNALAKTLPDQDLVYAACHANAARGKGWRPARGHRVFYKAWSPESKKMASLIDTELCKAWPNMPSRGIKAAPFLKECRGPKMPSVLIEFGFMTNELDCEYLSDHNLIIDGAAAVTRALLGFAEWRAAR